MAAYERLVCGADDEEHEEIGVEVATGGHRVSRRLAPPGA